MIAPDGPGDVGEVGRRLLVQPPPRSERERGGLPTRLLGLLAASAVVAACWLAIDSIRVALSMPAQLNYLDGYMVDDAIRLARGGPLYLDPSSAPYSVTVYTPGTFVVMAGLIATGVDGFAAGRGISLLAMLAMAVLIARSGWGRTGWFAVLIGAAYVLHPLQWPWSLVIRPDLLAAALSVAAVLVASRSERSPWTLTSALLCVAALLTKQTAVAAPVAILLGLAIRRRRDAAMFAAALAAGLTACVATLEWSSNGRFLFSTVTANRNPFSWQRAFAMYDRFATLDTFTAPLVVVLALRTVRRKPPSIVSLYALASLVTALASGKLGSSLNYFLEPLAAVALWAAWDFPVEWFRGKGPVRVVIAALLLAAFAVSAAASWIDQLVGHRAARASLPAHQRLVEIVAAVDGAVVSDDATILVGAGKRVHFRPFIMTQLAEAGRWDQTPFLDDLSGRQIAMILYRSLPDQLHRSRYTEEMRREMDRNYRPAFSYVLGAPFIALVPRPDPLGSTPEAAHVPPSAPVHVQSGTQGG